MDQFMKYVFSKKGFSGILLQCFLFSFTAIATLCGAAMVVYALCTVNLLIGICGLVFMTIWMSWLVALWFYVDMEGWK